MNAAEMTLAKFDEILARANFSLLTYPERHAFEGAGPRALIAEVDDVIIIADNGEFEVMCFDGEWSFSFNSEGKRVRVM